MRAIPSSTFNSTTSSGGMATPRLVNVDTPTSWLLGCGNGSAVLFKVARA
jgi:hypothetical protein